MEKKMVFLVGCLVAALLLCGVPQVVSAFDYPEGQEEGLVADSDAGEPAFDEDDEFAEDEDFDQDEEAGEEYGYDEEDLDEEY